LNERLLTAQLGVSRTPLREAFKVLATEGLVELLPNRGAIVSEIDAVRLAETLAVMGALEALAGEFACVNASDGQVNEIRSLHHEMLANHARGDLAGYFKFNQAIHLKIVKYSGNTVLYNTYRQLNANVRRARYMANLSQERWMPQASTAIPEAPRATWSASKRCSRTIWRTSSSVLGDLRGASARQHERSVVTACAPAAQGSTARPPTPLPAAATPQTLRSIR
jgi:DNA-binding GntR family transcriptional regulator